MNDDATPQPRSKSKDSQNNEPDTKRYKLSNIEVCEFYSPPRVVPKAIGKHIKKGMSFDISQPDQYGNSWDFRLSSHRQKAREYVNKNKPKWIIGSPPCDQFSIMQNLNQHKVDPIIKHKRLMEAKVHLAFCAELYKM